MNGIGAIGNALQTGQVQRPQAVGANPQAMQAMSQRPEFAALAQQVGPEMAMQILIGKQQQARAATAQGVANLGMVGQQEDPRAQMVALMRQAQA